MYKCPICELGVAKEEAIPYKNRYLHPACFNNTIKVTVNEKKKQAEKKIIERKGSSTKKPKAELKDGLTEQEFQDKQILFSTIKRIQGSEVITAKTHKLISDYMKNYGFTFKGIAQSLEFFYEIADNSATEDCIGIVPYIYDESQEFFSLGEKTLKANEDIDFNKIDEMYKTNVVKISPQEAQLKQIDIGSIGE